MKRQTCLYYAAFCRIYLDWRSVHQSWITSRRDYIRTPTVAHYSGSAFEQMLTSPNNNYCSNFSLWTIIIVRSCKRKLPQTMWVVWIKFSLYSDRSLSILNFWRRYMNKIMIDYIQYLFWFTFYFLCTRKLITASYFRADFEILNTFKYI